jgi:alkanesulfonate monooxygenase SsuD/methylene tetrahydromethanopterin reductase-like flavin-dependent oxidoreductase (luciferase family)
MGPSCRAPLIGRRLLAGRTSPRGSALVLGRAAPDAVNLLSLQRERQAFAPNARLAGEAEEAGWHGVFVWDHVCWGAPVRQVADAWITLAAITAATDRVWLGAMVTPLARRRPVKVARETATLDRLSGGRLTLGVGLGSDRFGGELSKTGEQVDDRRRGQMLDESLDILTAAWSGQPVHHHGPHYTVDGIRFLPRPVQRPGVLV